MFTSISVTNFRGIAHGQVAPLRPLTVIVGPNNSGKSTLLESCLIAASHEIEHLKEVVKRRGWLGLHGLRYLFYGPEQAATLQVELAGTAMSQTCSVGVDRVKWGELVEMAHRQGLHEPLAQLRLNQVAVVVNEDGTWSEALVRTAEPRTPPATLLDLSVVERYGSLEDSYAAVVRQGQAARQALLEMMVHLRPGLSNLEILPEDGRYALHLVDEHGSSPLYFAGDGYKRLFQLAATLAGPQGLFLLEEPETFQHPRALSQAVQLIHSAVQRGSQVVVSTHSLELLGLLLPPEGQFDLEQAAVFRTQLRDGKLTSVFIDGPRAAHRVDLLGEDLRA